MKKQDIELDAGQVKDLRERLKKHALEDGDYEALDKMMENLLFLRQAYQDKSISERRLLRYLFGPYTETVHNIFVPKEKKSKIKKKPKGHGRNGVRDYPGAKKVVVEIPGMKPGDHCPECHKGKVYKKEPKPLLRFRAAVPIQATAYEMEKFRCNLCGETFTAPTPEEAGEKKYDETVGPMIAVLKYGYGLPFYRIEKLQECLGIPLAASTQWGLVSDAERYSIVAYKELIRQAAQGDIIHNDDTVMKILAMMNLEDRPDGKKKSKRSGMYTTGIFSEKDDLRIALYFTGQNHAGENLEELLKNREKDLKLPIQMCDALSRNLPKTLKTILANCLSHGRRNFYDLLSNWPEECQYVIEILGEVYKNDDLAKQDNLSPPERLRFHQEKSGPLMEKLESWLHKQIDEKLVEPNSGLGKAINYMLNHWDPLTLFLRVEGAPLHNNLCEQVLKRAVLHRKNSMFYKTQRGAEVGDVFMSIIHTCYLAGANPFEYLVALQLHHEAVAENPHLWMPWNYKDSLPAKQ